MEIGRLRSQRSLEKTLTCGYIEGLEGCDGSIVPVDIAPDQAGANVVIWQSQNIEINNPFTASLQIHLFPSLV